MTEAEARVAVALMPHVQWMHADLGCQSEPPQGCGPGCQCRVAAETMARAVLAALAAYP